MHCKSYSHFFSKKFQHICISLNENFNESLTNNVVSFEQLGPDGLLCNEIIQISNQSLKTVVHALWLSYNTGVFQQWSTPISRMDKANVQLTKGTWSEQQKYHTAVQFSQKCFIFFCNSISAILHSLKCPVMYTN